VAVLSSGVDPAADADLGVDVVESLTRGLRRAADGRAAAERIVTDAAPHTREAIGRDLPADASRMLFVGEDALDVRQGLIELGGQELPWAEVRDRARRGGAICLPGGGRLPAALVLLVVAAFERERPR
jgi:hypothetical protein